MIVEVSTRQPKLNTASNIIQWEPLSQPAQNTLEQINMAMSQYISARREYSMFCVYLRFCLSVISTAELNRLDVGLEWCEDIMMNQIYEKHGAK